MRGILRSPKDISIGRELYSFIIKDLCRGEDKNEIS